LGCGGCKKAKLDSPTDHERFLGSGAACTWKTGSPANHEVICVKDGRRYVCIRLSCAVTPESPLER
jgi:hypothetical protein